LSVIKAIIKELKTIYDIYIALSMTGIGVFTLLIDSKSFKRRKLKREARFAKVIGVIYIITGPLLYIVLMVA